MYKKPYPLYHKQIETDPNQSIKKVVLIRVCQDCGYIETEHRWRHIFIHPDYELKKNNLQ